ncbi:PA2169 family four-helix-bundle protein [Geminicoccaceae bacterium 1502E]|nr:PA2169 family four-helix-bundle protein [Geminicoccaceae bacterium 1502E]
MSESTTLLTSLVQTTIDSAEGYERAAEHAKAAELKQVLRDQAARRRQLVNDLNTELVRLGGERQERGTTSGAAHRIWTQVSTAFKDNDEAAAERVEEGEDYLEKKFREALDRSDWEPATLRVLQQAHAQVKEGERLTDRLEDRYD